MADKKTQPSEGKKDTSYRAQRFWDQRVDHASKKGQSGISLHELQAGFQGYLRALDKKAKKYDQPNTDSGKPA